MPQMSPQQWFWMNLMSQMTGQNIPTVATPPDLPPVTDAANPDPTAGYYPDTSAPERTPGQELGVSSSQYPVYPDYTGLGYQGGPFDPTPASTSTGPEAVASNFLPDGMGGYALNPVWSNLPAGGLTSGQQVEVPTDVPTLQNLDLPAADPSSTPTTAPDVSGLTDVSGVPTTEPPAGSSLIWSPTEQAWVPPTSPSLSASPATDTGTTDTSGIPTAPGVTPDVLPASPVDPTGSGITWSADPNQIYGPTTAPNLWNQPTDWSNLGNQVSNVVDTAGGAISNVATNLGNFLGNIFTGTDPTPNIAPGGSPVGSTTPDAVAPGIPLPGATVGGGGGAPTNIGSSAAQLALFHGVWGGKAPMDYNTWNAGAGTPEGWASRPGGNYQNYLNIWNALRSQQATAPPQTRQRVAAQGGSSGQGQGTTGREASTAAR